MGEAIDRTNGLGRKELAQVKRRFFGLHRERIRRIASELLPRQRDFLDLLPLLFHINHPMLPGYCGSNTPAGIPDFSPTQAVLRTAKRLSRSFSYEKRALRRFHIQGLYLMGSIGSIAHTSGSDFDVWLCYNPGLSALQLERLREKVRRIEAWAEELRLEVHIFLIDSEQFRQGKRDRLSSESSGTTQPRLLLEEFYRTGVLLAGRYPMWWLIPPEQEDNYQSYAERLIHQRFVDPSECIDFGSLEQLPPEEFFGAAHWQLYKGVESPYKSILKLHLIEAYSRDYPRVHWLCQDVKKAIYDGVIDVDTLDPYVLMYRRVERYLLERNEPRRLELARRCFYFKADRHLSRPNARANEPWQRELLRLLTREWGWDRAQLVLLDGRDSWKIDRVLEERNTLVRELTHSYRLLTDFARQYARGGIDSEELALLGRKLYTALEKRPGKIDLINPGISRSLEEERLSLHHLEGDSGRGWSLYLGDVNQSQGKVTAPLKRTNSLIEMLAWCHLNQVVGNTTQISLHPESLKRQQPEIEALLDTLRDRHPRPEHGQIPLHRLASPPFALSSTLFVNIGTDPMEHLSRQGKQLTSNRSDPLSFGGAHQSLVENLEHLVFTSWGETLVLKHKGVQGLFDSLCHYLRLTLLANPGKPAPTITAHSFSSVRGGSIARRVEQLFNTVSQCFGPQGQGLDGRFLVRAADQLVLIQCQSDNFNYLVLEDEQALLDTLGEVNERFRPLQVDTMTLEEHPIPAIYQVNRPGQIQIFYQQSALYILDEQGSLFHQPLQNTDEHYLLVQQQRFFNGLLLLRNLTAADPLHRLLLDAPEFYQLQRERGGRFVAEPRTPPRHRMPDSYMELRFVGDSLEFNASPFLLVCADREFSSLELGDSIFSEVAGYLLAQRREREDYPIYLTGLELSGAAQERASSTIEILRFRQRLENRLNQALAEQLQGGR